MRQALKSGARGRFTLAAIFTSATIAGLLIAFTPCFAAEPPQAEITNGQITARIYLPDAKDGYYRSTRFDWSGAIFSLRYKGHEFYGKWYDTVDPKVINWVHRDGQIVDGPCGALQGPVDEFQTPLGYEDAAPGGRFIKIGVGVLHKTEGGYNRYFPYEVLDPGKWTVKRHKDSVEFTQVLNAPDLGYSYVYRKVVRLVKGQPRLLIERSLKNTGAKEIKSQVYDHNFVVLDHQPPGPDFTFRVPFEISTSRAPNKDLVEVKGNEVVYKKQLLGQDEAAVLIQGFSESPKDSEIVIENKKVNAGLKISGDRPLIRELLWSIRSVLAVEPYVAIDVQPDAEFNWSNAIDYYTLPPAK